MASQGSQVPAPFAAAPASAGGRLSLLVKPAGDACDLACRYCFYRGRGPSGDAVPARMPTPVLEALLAQALRPGGAATVELAWQGGEPLLMGPAFYRRAFDLQRRLRPRGVAVVNTFQTNGRLLDDAWCELLAEHRCLVGLSVDGPAELHDPYRPDRQGAGSHAAVVAAADRLRRAGVEVNALIAVHAGNQNRPGDVYRYVVDELGLEHLQFLPVVQSPGNVLAVDPAAYGEFLVGVLAEWAQRDVGRVFVQQIESVAATLLGAPGSCCAWAPTCGGNPVIERNGDVYSCDHFVGAAHRLGNLLATPLATLIHGAAQRDFGLAKWRPLAAECEACPELPFCGGGCPKDRPTAAAGTGVDRPAPSALCAGYRRFFPAARAVLANLQSSPSTPASITIH